MRLLTYTLWQFPFWFLWLTENLEGKWAEENVEIVEVILMNDAEDVKKRSNTFQCLKMQKKFENVRIAQVILEVLLNTLPPFSLEMASAPTETSSNENLHS